MKRKNKKKYKMSNHKSNSAKSSKYSARTYVVNAEDAAVVAMKRMKNRLSLKSQYNMKVVVLKTIVMIIVIAQAKLAVTTKSMT